MNDIQKKLFKTLPTDLLSTFVKIAEENSQYSILLPDAQKELNNKLADNKLYSKEDFCNFRKGFIVLFAHGSQAHQLYGEKAVLKVNFDEAELELLMRNKWSEPPISTYGIIQAESLERSYSGSHNIFFDTKDVVKVL